MVTPVFHSKSTLSVKTKKQKFQASNSIYVVLLITSYLIGKQYGALISDGHNIRAESPCTSSHPAYQAAFDARVDSLSEIRKFIQSK